jgi:D-lactate dehydrogenase
MQVTFFSTRPYDKQYFSAANTGGRHAFRYLDARLALDTAPLAANADAVCVFVNDTLDRQVLDVLHRVGVRLVALRCAGYNNVDLGAAAALGLPVVRVPAYSPHAVAEHTFALILALNRHLHRAFSRIRDGNFSLDNLVGFDLYGKTVGVVGTGAIGREVVRIARGFGCHVLAFDPMPSPAVTAAGAVYVALPELLAGSDIVTLHCPLTPDTFHLVNGRALDGMRRGCMLINTSRGALVDTPAAIAALKSGQLGSLGIDVYEEESSLFFVDHSSGGIPDDVFARLVTFPNVFVTGHQAFLTREALTAIAATTLASLDEWEAGRTLTHGVTSPAR